MGISISVARVYEYKVNYIPSMLQIDTCNQEAVKLATFINNQTPMLASDPYLSHMVAAKVQTAKVKDIDDGGHRPSTPKPPQISAAARPTASAAPLLVLVTVMVILLHTVPLVHFASR